VLRLIININTRRILVSFDKFINNYDGPPNLKLSASTDRQEAGNDADLNHKYTNNDLNLAGAEGWDFVIKVLHVVYTRPSIHIRYGNFENYFRGEGDLWEILPAF
jgi:hypothetical protein